MKITRRRLAAAVLGPATIAVAQTQPAATTDDEVRAARDRMRTNAEALASVKLPMAVEPAFQFKA